MVAWFAGFQNLGTRIYPNMLLSLAFGTPFIVSFTATKQISLVWDPDAMAQRYGLMVYLEVESDSSPIHSVG